MSFGSLLLSWWADKSDEAETGFDRDGGGREEEAKDETETTEGIARI